MLKKIIFFLFVCLFSISLSQAQTAEVWFEKAHQKEETGDFKGAIVDYNKAIAAKPTYGEAFYGRGQAYLDLQGFPGAIDDFTKAIKYLPANHLRLNDAYFNRGYARLSTKQYATAIEDFNFVLNKTPDHAMAYIHRAECNTALGKPKEAVKDYSMAIELDGENADGYYLRGLARLKADEATAACADFKHAETLGHAGATQALKEHCR